MKKIDVYRNEDLHRYDGVEYGFSVWACCFTFFWAFCTKQHKLALFLFLFYVFTIILGAVLEAVNHSEAILIVVVAWMSIAVYLGINGNGLKRRSLLRRSYNKVITTQGRTMKEAIESTRKVNMKKEHEPQVTSESDDDIVTFKL